MLKLYFIWFTAMILVGHGSLHAQWVHQGSAPSTNGQVEGISDKEVAGAVSRLAPHPANSSILYIGAVNGGIWRTSNAEASDPDWTYISFDMPGQSIGALEFDPTDPRNQTLVAAIGRFSSFGGFGAGSYGVFRTSTGTGPWMNLDVNGILGHRDIRALAARGAVIVVAGDDGIWRTANMGQNWTRISGRSGTGLPTGRSYALGQDPNDKSVLYSHAGKNGLYKSMDTGSTWKKISSADIDRRMGSMDVIDNIKIAVGRNKNVYVAIVYQGRLHDLLRSGDGGISWKPLDLPITIEHGRTIGIHAGAQGDLHLSLAADPKNPATVYVGGDRQPYANEPDTPVIWPNSVGALDFSGRLFRVDASREPGSQALPLTHNGTAKNSSPHADSRDLRFDAAGNLIEADDGGVYKRTSPQSKQGDWFSLNGNLEVTEIHSVAWDEKFHIILSGAQDVGVPQQETPNNIRWVDVSEGDGGQVAVDNLSSTLISVRYSSNDSLHNFLREEWTPAKGRTYSYYPELADNITHQQVSNFDFVAPIRLNSQNGKWLLVASCTALFESTDDGATLNVIGDFAVNAGGRHALAYGAADDVGVVYAGAGSKVWIRSSGKTGFFSSPGYRGGLVMGASNDPGNSKGCFVIDSFRVYHTSDTGSNWVERTGDLASLHPGTLLTIAYIPATQVKPARVVVGGEAGVFMASAPNFNSWSRLGDNLPPVAVFDLEFDSKDSILVAGTMGLGAWTLKL